MNDVASEWRCAWLTLSDRDAYVQAHVADLTAVNRAAPDGIWRKIIDDPIEFAPHALAWQQLAIDGISNLRSRLLRSGLATLATAAVAVAIAFAAGASNPSLPFSLVKATVSAGAGVMAWATVLGLGTPPSTWDGPALPDRVLPKLFVLIFLPGLALVLVGGLL